MGYIVLVVFIMYGIIHHQINHFVVTKYFYADKKIPNAFDGYKIVHLSDLHSKQFGRDNHRLIHKIKAIKPDVLIVTGDMVNSTDHKGDIFLEIARQLVHTCEI
ncbi:MAG: metallophosphoesterase, partial [Turicibacter sp.]